MLMREDVEKMLDRATLYRMGNQRVYQQRLCTFAERGQATVQVRGRIPVAVQRSKGRVSE